MITVILSLYLGKQPVSTTNVPRFLGSMRSGLILFTLISMLGTVFSMIRIREKLAERSCPATDRTLTQDIVEGGNG